MLILYLYTKVLACRFKNNKECYWKNRSKIVVYYQIHEKIRAQYTHNCFKEYIVKQNLCLQGAVFEDKIEY